MTSPQELQTAGSFTLSAPTAADLMTANPVSISQDATVKDAAAFLTDRGFSAAPVIDNAGRPVGVLSRADIVVHHRQKAEYVPPVPDYYQRTDLATSSGEPLPSGFQVESVDQTRVRDIMIQEVVTVHGTTPVVDAGQIFLQKKFGCLPVVRDNNRLEDIITVVDLLRAYIQ